MIDVRIHGIGDYELLSNVNISVNGWDINVYSGFKWDGASIPRSLWEEIGCPMDYMLESCIHDALYRTHLLDRKTSDKILHELVKQSNGSVVAKAMYLGVRFGGDSAYEKAKYSMAHYRDYVSILPI